MPSFPFAEGALLTTVSRSGRVESWHRGSVAVWHGSDLLLSLGAPKAAVICRSATKPFQALPFLERGLDQKFGLTAAEIAVMCASHDGADAPTACVRGFLKKAGLHEGQLGCGPHAPFDTATPLPPSTSGRTSTPPMRIALMAFNERRSPGTS